MGLDYFDYHLTQAELDEIRDIARVGERKRITDILLRQIDSDMKYASENDTPWGHANYEEDIQNCLAKARCLEWMILVIEGKEND